VKERPLKSAQSPASIVDFKVFQFLTPTSRSVLERGLQYVNLVQAAPVLHKGQRVSGAYVVVSGQLRVFTLSPHGKEATLYLINPGETCVLALNCIFSDLLYPAWVEASAATRLAIIPGLEFRILFESEPAIRNMTVQAFSTVVFRLMAEIEEIHSYKLEERLISFLLLHASHDGRLQITQQRIASHLGTTREVIARALGQLTSSGHIQPGRSEIVLKDPPKLAGLLKTREARARRNDMPASRLKPRNKPTRPLRK